jgi:hypothetical protein
MRVTLRRDRKLELQLPRPFPARSTLKDWLRTMTAKANSDIHGRDNRTVKQCRPLSIG